MCKSVTVSSLCASQHFSLAWTDSAPKLTSTLIDTKTKNPVNAHVTFLRHGLTNPLEHGDVQLLADVFDTCSAEPQSPVKAWLGRSVVFSLGTWSSKPTDREMLSIKAKSLSICCTVLTSVINLTVASTSAATVTMPSTTQNFELTTKQLVRQEVDE